MKTMLLSTTLLAAAVSLLAVRPASELKLTILYDNYLFDKAFKNSWGFSCLIEGLDKTILFDCGGQDGNLMHNLRAAGIDPSIVDLVVISHEHWDHTGGMPEFLDACGDIDVWMPASFIEQFSKDVRDRGCKPVAVTRETEIIPGVWTTGEMGTNIIEQSLVIETDKGLIVITGCAHPGIEQIVARATGVRDRDILIVMGGFHLLQTGKGKVEEIAKSFKSSGVKYAAPTHCSGDGTIEIFKEVFGDRFVQLGAGRVLELNEL